MYEWVILTDRAWCAVSRRTTGAGSPCALLPHRRPQRSSGTWIDTILKLLNWCAAAYGVLIRAAAAALNHLLKKKYIWKLNSYLMLLKLYWFFISYIWVDYPKILFSIEAYGNRHKTHLQIINNFLNNNRVLRTMKQRDAEARRRKIKMKKHNKVFLDS